MRTLMLLVSLVWFSLVFAADVSISTAKVPYAGSMVSVAKTHNGVMVMDYYGTIAKYLDNGALLDKFKIPDYKLRQVKAVAVQKDGKILVGGFDYNNLVVIRLNLNGTVDTKFGSSLTPIGAKASVKLAKLPVLSGMLQAMTIQNDGKIIISGQATGNDRIAHMVVARFSPDGLLDLSFNKFGYYMSTAQGDSTSVAVQADGKILVGGRINYKAAVVRINSNGTLDMIKSSTLNGSVNAVKEKQGKIFAAGYVISGTSMKMFVSKFLSDGKPDVTFNKNGYKEMSIGVQNNIAYDIVVQDSERIVVVGQSDTGKGTANSPRYYNPTAIRLTSYGDMDTSFGMNGVAIYNYGWNSNFQAVFSISNEITVVGELGIINNKKVIAAKYQQ